MKKLLFLGLLSVAGVGMSASAAHAWFLDCCRNFCCDRYCTKLCVRPYNAFSPVAYGSIVADGCMPLNVVGGHYPPPYMAPYGCYPSYGPGCCTSGNCDVGCLPAPGSFGAMPSGAMPPGAMPPGGMPTMPMPMPVPQGSPGPQFQVPNPQILNQSSYRVPMATPVNYYAPPQAPAYWYGR
jgi:hypothetical protein